MEVMEDYDARPQKLVRFEVRCHKTAARSDNSEGTNAPAVEDSMQGSRNVMIF